MRKRTKQGFLGGKYRLNNASKTEIIWLIYNTIHVSPWPIHIYIYIRGKDKMKNEKDDLETE
jgi:hypothetical protein